MIKKTPILGISFAAVFAVSMMFAFSTPSIEAVGGAPTSTFLVQDSATLEGFAGAYVMVDTTHKQIVEAHVAVVDTTETCDLGNESDPDNIIILVGDAVDIATGANAGAVIDLFNFGIAVPNGCVFHGDIDPATLGLPSFTDIVVIKSSAEASSTVSVTAEVAQD